MITNTNYAFRVNISLDGYARKSDSTACLSRAGAKAIGKEKMAFVEQSITVDDFLFYASSSILIKSIGLKAMALTTNHFLSTGVEIAREQ